MITCPCAINNDGVLCDACFKTREAEMMAYFGLRKDMTLTEWRAQLERVDPRYPTAEDLDEARKLK